MEGWKNLYPPSVTAFLPRDGGVVTTILNVKSVGHLQTQSRHSMRTTLSLRIQNFRILYCIYCIAFLQTMWPAWNEWIGCKSVSPPSSLALNETQKQGRCVPQKSLTITTVNVTVIILLSTKGSQLLGCIRVSQEVNVSVDHRGPRSYHRFMGKLLSIKKVKESNINQVTSDYWILQNLYTFRTWLKFCRIHDL